MARDVVVRASPIPEPSELLSQTILAIYETVLVSRTVLIQKENFKKFSKYLENITFILKELSKPKVSYSGNLNRALEILCPEVRGCKEIATECSTRNKIYLLINSGRFIKCLESSTKEIARALGLIHPTSLDISSTVTDEIANLCNIMLNAEYRTTVVEEAILEKIEWGKQQRNVDHSFANNLLALTAKAIGISTDLSMLKKELEELWNEIEEVKLRGSKVEALQMEHISMLLGKADAASFEVKLKIYHNKRNSLGRQSLEPLHSFKCPLTQDVMLDPVETPSGKTYERSDIEKWLTDGNQLCPLTRAPLTISDLRPNKSLHHLIEEWKDRNIINAIVSKKPMLQSNKEDEVIDALGKLQEICLERELHREWIIMEDYAPILIGLLRVKNHDIRTHVLLILYTLAKDGDDNKERIAKVDNAIESIVRSLARKIEERKLALQLLLELSRSYLARDMIGSVQKCILLVVNMSSSDDSQAAKDATELLENLSFFNQNVIQMARANYFRPLLYLLISGPDDVKLVMAETLSDIELTEPHKISLFRNGALEPLLQLLSHDDIDLKKVAVKALQNLSTVPQNGLQMIREGALGPLLEILYRHSLSLPNLREQVAATIMHLTMSTTSEEANQEQYSLLESEEDIFKLFSLVSLTGPGVQQRILLSFYAMCQSPFGMGMRTKLRQLSAVQVLVQLCELDNHAVRESAVKLFYCLTKDGQGDTFLEHVGQKCIESLLIIITTSNNVEEISAAIGIISNLPDNDQISQWLVDAQALEIIFGCLTSGNSNANALHDRQVTENAVRALRRFTISTKQEWQMRVCEAGIIHVLVKFLVSGTALTKQNAAVSLKQFSESSVNLSRPVKKNWLSIFCLAKPNAGCPAHSGICTVESSFCLVEANAVDPLVRMLGETDAGAAEASLDALSTLIDGEMLQRGSKVFEQANAITPIIRLLSSPHPRLQEKALKTLERIFQMADFTQKYGASAQVPLIDIMQIGSRSMKSLAGRVLAQLKVLHDQSSYF